MCLTTTTLLLKVSLEFRLFSLKSASPLIKLTAETTEFEQCSCVSSSSTFSSSMKLLDTL
uniref:Hypothetical secreted peptide n=1 Tax=Glossina morsitans morsitans TaxID=37546 RepID=D3TSQ7_GLOMM